MGRGKRNDSNRNEPSRKERIITMGVIPVISIVVATGVSIYLASADNEVLRAQFEAGLAKQDEQNRIMNQSMTATIERLDEQNRIMNLTLTATLESLQKKSDIQVIIDPLSGMYEINAFSISTTVSKNNDNVSQIFEGTNKKLEGVVLIRNRTAAFSVVVANVGSNIARVDHISATVVPIEQNNTLGILTQTPLEVKQNLAPTGQPMEFAYSFLVTEEFAPKGYIYFQIYHDSDRRDYPPIYYEYSDFDPELQNP